MSFQKIRTFFSVLFNILLMLLIFPTIDKVAENVMLHLIMLFVNVDFSL